MLDDLLYSLFENLCCSDDPGRLLRIPWLNIHPIYAVISLNPRILLLIVVPDT
jgi:hypothetical protein